MGTKKGQRRKTARRAYEKPKKDDVHRYMEALTDAVKRRDTDTTKKLSEAVVAAGIDMRDLFKLKTRKK